MIGERIKQARLALGYSAEQVAAFLHVSPATIYRYENGDISKLPSKFIKPLAEFLCVTPEYLMGWTGESSDKPHTEEQIIRNPKIRLLASQMDKLPVEQQEQALEVFNAMYHKFFDHMEDEKK